MPTRHIVRGRIRAFTLVELLIVISIIVLMTGMIIGLPSPDKRRAAVRSAAEELAATLRAARSYAMNQAVVCGVAFNLQNAPDTSGMVLNNWSGGHWYRIIGPQAPTNTSPSVHTYPIPDYNDTSVQGRGNVAQFLATVDESWLGEPHVLAPRRVRFLALTDQDSGTGGWESSGRIPATYPRPWYGYWSAGTLYPWGGYDGSKPAASRIRDPSNRYCSGFYYEGNDGTVAGCRNPIDRTTTATGASGTVPLVQFLKAGEPRALINAAWLDFVIVFNPDGTVQTSTSQLYARAQSYWERGAATDSYSQGGTGNGDLGPYSAMQAGDVRSIQSFFRHTGAFSITLAPDADRDSDAYASAKEAFDSIWPMSRVQVNQFGSISVIDVSASTPANLTFDTTSITNWQTTAQITTYYKKFIATNSDGTLRTNASGKRYRPVENFLTPQILASRQWWATW